MKYNFDKHVCRLNTNSTKWQQLENNNLQHKIIPMWIADMEFEVCENVVEKIKERLTCPVFGYTLPSKTIYNEICGWYQRRYNYHIEAQHITITTSVLSTLCASINLWTNENDKVIIPVPNYHQFREKVLLNNRVPLYTEMVLENNRFKIDFESLEKQIDENTKMFILCNPHNPLGMKYTKDELVEIANFCEKHQLKIFADEIHIDFLFDNRTFVAIADLTSYTKANTITALSISKTFNMSGMKVSSCVIKDEALKADFDKVAMRMSILTLNTLGLVAMESCYKEAEEWFDELLDYLNKTRKYAYNFIKENMPQTLVYEAEATYFLWLDLSCTNLKGDKLKEAIMDECNIQPSMGEEFYSSCDSCIRINMGVRFDVVKDALDALHQFIKKYE